MSDPFGEIERSDLLGIILSKDSEQPQSEPTIAANIHEQLQHMGLSTWSLSILRRLRDAIGRLQPNTLLEVGASIGHRTAWILDDFDRKSRVPDALTLVEPGGKFGVILKRLLARYDALAWSNVVVGDPAQLAAEHQAWSLVSATGLELSQTPFEPGYDVIIVDGPSPVRADLVSTYLPQLNTNGVLFTVEPDMPTGEVAEDDEAGMALVAGFNRWIEVVGETQTTHHLAFMPLFGGTLVAWLPVQS